MFLQKTIFEQHREKRILARQIDILHLARMHEELDMSIKEILHRLETTIREYFFGICSVEIRKCPKALEEHCDSCTPQSTRCDPAFAKPSLLRRGHDSIAIPLGKKFFIVFQYPRSRRENFEQIFEKNSPVVLKAAKSVIGIEGMKAELEERTAEALENEAARANLQKTLGRYVSPVVVDEILRGRHSTEVGGIIRNISVSFSDLVGFTGISERYNPKTVVAILNSFFGPANSIIFNRRGTLNKYL
jgi:hypothetical protein